MKTFLYRVASVLLVVGFVLFFYGVGAGINENWDVPKAMITAHQSWNAFWVGAPFCALGFIAVFCAILAVAFGDNYERRKR